jgi:hypothetical protein
MKRVKINEGKKESIEEESIKFSGTRNRLHIEVDFPEDLSKKERNQRMKQFINILKEMGL